MWEKQLLLSIVLLGLIGGSKSESLVPAPSGYPVTSPSVQSQEKKCDYIVGVSPVLRSGDPETMCANLQSEESVQLEVILEYQSIRIVVFSVQIDPGTQYFECREFNVPIVSITVLAYVTIIITGQTVKKNERRAVAIDIMPTACTFQMEKNMYAPGETVRFRIICMDYELKAIQPNCSRIYFVDPNGAYVAQIEEPIAENYMISGEFILSGQATLGSFRIDCVKDDGDTLSQYVTVQQYILPRFEAQLSCANAISVSDKTAEISVSAQYVYGRPLDGIVIVKCTRTVAYYPQRSRNCMKGLEDISVEFTRTLESGVWTEDMNLDTFRMQFSEYDDSLQCTVTVKETGTGVLDTKYCYIYISRQPANLQLESYGYQYYKHGLDLPFVITLKNEKGEPIAYKNVTIEVDGEHIKQVTTDVNGKAECGIDTTPYYKSNLTVRACYPDEDQCYFTDQSYSMFDRFGPMYPYPYNPGYPCTETTVYRTFSETDCYLQIRKESSSALSCSESHSIEVEYKVTEAGVGEGEVPMTVYYTVTSKLNMVSYGQKDVDLTNGWKGSFTIDVSVDATYGSEAQLLVYATMGAEVISDTWQLSINPCLNNQVYTTFTESVVAPGSEVTQQVSAAPRSICGLRAWDSRLDLLGYNYAVTPETMQNLVRYYQYGYQVKDFNLEAPTPPCEDPNKIMFCDGRYVQRTSSPTDGDTYNNLRSSGVMFFTNLLMIKPQVCGMEQTDYHPYPPYPMYFKTAGGLAHAAVDESGGGSSSIQTLRTNFIDIFGWDALIIGDDGTADRTTTIPDAITNWKSDTICVSKEAGVGVSNETAKITTFLPFFVDPSMPKYCTRGETVEVDVTVVNYLDKCVKFRLTIEYSDDFEFNSMSDDGDTFCICKGERATKSYSANFSKLGEVNMTISAETITISDSCDGTNDDSEPPRKDTVIVIMNVAAEGIEQEVVFSHLNLVQDSTIENLVTITEPDDLVANTSQLSVRVTGDTTGIMIAHLKNLLRQPAGCCEQMLAQIIPLYFLRKYFEFVGNIDDKVNEEAKSLLCSGYGTMLSCRRWDGQCTLFPNSPDTVNNWVLVKMFFAFDLMKEQNCYIDDSVQQKSLERLGELQDLTTGCLTPTGPFLTTPDDTNMQMHFTAYTVAHLKQCGNLYGIGEPIIERAMTCLGQAEPASLDTYTVAYLFYAAALCGLDDIWYKASDILKHWAITSDGTTYWTIDNLPLSNPQYVPSSYVDMTAIILMGFMRGPEPDLDYLGPIAAWLISCMNSRGGFISSQDTMSATQAMTEYGRMVFVKNTDCKVVLSQNDTELARMSVTEVNKMLVQEQSLDFTSRIIKMTTTGTCSLLLQIVYSYNTKLKTDSSSFSLSVTTTAASCTADVAPVIFTKICITYTGSENRTNMVIIGVRQITGYPIDSGSLYQLKSDNTVSNFGFDGNYVFLYFEFMEPGVKICLTLTSYMEARVPYRMNSLIYAADYYNTAVTASALYVYSCSPAQLEVE